MNTQENNLPPSNYTVKFSDNVGRVAVVDKLTGKVKESFSPAIDDSFIIFRMQEIREFEIFQHNFLSVNQSPTSFGKEVIKGGLILPPGY